MGAGSGRSTTVEIRKVRAEEWPALRHLRLRALELDPLAFGSTLAEESAFAEDRWRTRATQGAESSASAQWVAELPDGQLVGSVVVAKVEGAVFVFGMWVEPDHRGRGLGAQLLDTGLRWARATFPGEPIRLDVNPRQTAAVGLYRSRGFRRSGADRPLGHTPGEVRFEMTLDAS